MLESIKERLQSDKPLSNEELEKLKKLARPADSTGHEGREKEEEVSWTNVFRSRAKPQASDGELSKWDQQDLEKCAYETTQSSDIVVLNLF